jgi:hypothetical protein
MMAFSGSRRIMMGVDRVPAAGWSSAEKGNRRQLEVR